MKVWGLARLHRNEYRRAFHVQSGYLGKRKGVQLDAQGAFDRSAFTFANGIYCDTKEKVCHKECYFGAEGKPSRAIDVVTSGQLFGG
ncbi:YcgJ family protein [Serratia marcescens]|uniref:YcgJ family protein n=1 Tax=Serratia TaxID=613 RepID=UPI00356B7198